MKRIVLTLTDQEYAELERRAQQERRTPREMAAWLVTRPQEVTYQVDWTYRPPVYPQQWWQTPIISTPATGGCPGCLSPTGAFTHTCNQWQTISNASSSTAH
jgi:hypothetical protein